MVTCTYGLSNVKLIYGKTTRFNPAGRRFESATTYQILKALAFARAFFFGGLCQLCAAYYDVPPRFSTESKWGLGLKIRGFSPLRSRFQWLHRWKRERP